MNEKYYDSLLECPICLLPFKDPTTLPCGHTFCLEEAKLLSSCAMCNEPVQEGKKLTVNVILRGMVEMSIVNAKTSSQEVISPTYETSTSSAADSIPPENELKGDIIASIPEEKVNIIVESIGKPKKRKNKKVKSSVCVPVDVSENVPKVAPLPIELYHEIPQLYYNTRFKSQKDDYQRLSELSLTNPFAKCFMTVYGNDRKHIGKAGKKAAIQAQESINWLTTFHYQSDKYCLFLHCLLMELITSNLDLLSLEQSAEMGYCAAQFFLAEHLRNLNQVPEAIKWFKLAADAGIAPAQIFVSAYYDKESEMFGEDNPMETFKYTKMLADQGNAKAQNSVGAYYSGQRQGMPLDHCESLRYFKLSAEQNNADGLCNLGRFYSNPNFKNINEFESFKCFKAAADQRHAAGQFEVGRCYFEGVGVERDERKWFIYSKLAADQGHIAAQIVVAQCYFSGKAVPEDKYQSFRYFKMAADSNNPIGLFEVGCAYLNGNGVTMKKELGFKYVNQAADQGYSRAYEVLRQCYMNGEGVPMDQKKASGYMTLMLGPENFQSVFSAVGGSELGSCNMEEMLKTYHVALSKGEDSEDFLKLLTKGF